MITWEVENWFPETLGAGSLQSLGDRHPTTNAKVSILCFCKAYLSHLRLVAIYLDLSDCALLRELAFLRYWLSIIDGHLAPTCRAPLFSAGKRGRRL